MLFPVTLSKLTKLSVLQVIATTALRGVRIPEPIMHAAVLEWD